MYVPVTLTMRLTLVLQRRESTWKHGFVWIFTSYQT